MNNKIYIPKEELQKYNSDNTTAGNAAALLQQQNDTWPMLRDNYDQLNNVNVKEFEFDGFGIKVQFNPGRITSSAAKVDKKTISERKCFLCSGNLPEQQYGLEFEDYTILCNPFPIFPEHFTIPDKKHTPQRIKNNFASMLKLSRELGKNYSLFYNGPNCGASAPDHMHFQAGTNFFMPIEKDYDNFITSNSTLLLTDNDISVSAVNSYLRNIITIESSDLEKANDAFAKFYQTYESLFEFNEEPMMNVITSYKDNKWLIFAAPREKHRPDFYFAEGEQNILLSPASVDIGGVCITPLEKDFEKISKDDIKEIFNQVCLNGEKFKKLCTGLSDSFK